MKIQVLGSHGSDLTLNAQDPARSYRSSGFLIDDHLLLDAGTAASVLTLESQQAIDHVLLSHLHMDHVKELPALVDNLFGLRETPVTVWSTHEVLTGLKNSLFNDVLFPNFFDLPSPSAPILIDSPLRLGIPTALSGYRVTPVAVNHTVATVGYLIEDDGAAFLYSGDTYETDTIWSLASTIHNLRAVFIETSFPNDMWELARESKHLTPLLLAQEFKKIGRPDVGLYVYHLKPQYRERINQQLLDLSIPTLSVLEEGQEIVV